MFLVVYRTYTYTYIHRGCARRTSSGRPGARFAVGPTAPTAPLGAPHAARRRLGPLAARRHRRRPRSFWSPLCRRRRAGRCLPARRRLPLRAPAAVVSDFQAAFPSLARGFLARAPRRLGLPPSARIAVEGLCWGRGCRLAVGGRLHQGFQIQAGVRQGCPLLLALLFAVVVDPSLRRLGGALITFSSSAGLRG
ncbi:unnamed protein product [Prorocentrum cordatum]|uniref:Reverse transcriptase domain-containing protein n=1 Tax=Prorocentrum cordatum TaxID=2364126 RepID=A0ABN9TTI0_9DINO|nr:unnamed protein product [Polarella glacialis]